MIEKREKRGFSESERYAVWLHNEKRCWLCEEPLRLLETTIDHVIPERLLGDDREREELFEQFALPASFNINGFENWLPCHNHCNQRKSTLRLKFAPAYRIMLDRMISAAPIVERAANAILQNIKKDKLIAKIVAALESETIAIDELQAIFGTISERTSELVLLDNGYWLHRNDIVRQGVCTCDRTACVGHESKVHCVFARTLPDWVVTAGLYWKCYDEVVQCPRCHKQHKRGHVGASWVCGVPYRDQVHQRD